MGLTTLKYNQLIKQAEGMDIADLQEQYRLSAIQISDLRKRYEEEMEILSQVWLPILDRKLGRI